MNAGIVTESERPYQILLLLFGLVLLSGLAACRGGIVPSAEKDATEPPLATVAQGDAAGTDDYLYRSWRPALMVLGSREDVNDISSRLPLHVQERLQTLDYETRFVLIAFHGWRGKKGYGVEIERVEWREEYANVYAQFEQPEPGQEDDQVVSPYHVVQAPKPGDWGRDISFDLIVDGTVVASRVWPKKVGLPGEAEMPFDTLEQSEWGSGTGREYEGEEPAIIVIARFEEAELAEDWASADAQAQLNALDFSRHIALVVFQGRQPSSGYGIQIDRITRSGEEVNVYAWLREPRPLTETLATLAYPHHLVVIEKAQVRGVTRFNLVVDGMIVKSQVVEVG